MEQGTGEDRILVPKCTAGRARAGQLAFSEHAGVFHKHLTQKGTGTKTANIVKARIDRLIKLAEATGINDLTPSSVTTALKAVQDGDKDHKPASLQTCHHYLRAIKQFSRWLWRDGRGPTDALAHLKGYNAEVDRRYMRRALTDEELMRVIAAAEQGEAVLGMSGSDRAMLYRLASGTGFRAAELRSLLPESFDLNQDYPTVSVAAAYSKRRRNDTQPIRSDLAERLRSWLKGRPARTAVFNLPDKSAKMLRHDLDVARAKWIGDAPDDRERSKRERSAFLKHRDGAGRIVDFHGLRHTYVTRLVSSGASVKVAQELARHSTPTLTIGRYAHTRLHDLTAALANLPSTDDLGESEVAALSATGTDGAGAQPQQIRQQSAHETLHEPARPCDDSDDAPPQVDAPNPLDVAGLDEPVRGSAPQGEKRPEQDSNLRPAV